MEEKFIIAAIEEMKIHSLRFTMDDLTKNLHVSKTSVYKNAVSKDNLIHEVLNYLMAKFETEEKLIQSENISSQEKVSRFVNEYSKIFNFLEGGIYEDLRISYLEEWQRFEDFRRQKLDLLLDFINEGINRNEFRLVDTLVLRHCLITMSALLNDTKFLNDNDLTYSQAIESFRDLIFYGLLN